MLAISFYLIFLLTALSDNIRQEYPLMSERDCAQISGENDGLYMQQHAIYEFRDNEKLRDEGKDFSYYAGYLQCFCDAVAEKGQLPDETYVLAGEEYPICAQYMKSKHTSFMIQNLLMVTIISFNLLKRTTIIWLVKRIGYDTHSE